MRCNDRSSAVSGSLGKKRFSLEVNAAETEEKAILSRSCGCRTKATIYRSAALPLFSAAQHRAAVLEYSYSTSDGTEMIFRICEEFVFQHPSRVCSAHTARYDISVRFLNIILLFSQLSQQLYIIMHRMDMRKIRHPYRR